ncbi:MAG: hypothetical protein GX159_08340 [Flavobacteriaceae bacterium]|jgi:hypothetical protein|nr:hypothetical protein [Flavobacteriaceae bacterium]
MQVERLNNEILIRVPANTDLLGLQRILDYVRFREITSKSKATEEEIENIARESKSGWLKENKSNFVK